MWFSSWLRRRLSNPVPQNRNPHHFRPRLEALEDRWLPSQIGLTVTSLADSGPGTLRAAILTADADATKQSDKFTIAVNVSGTIDLQSPLPDLNASIAIQGLGAGSLTVERAAGFSFASAIVTVDAGQSASLAGLTIANGNAGGIFNNGGTLTVTGCTLSGNFAFNGGGIDNVLGKLAVTDSTFTGNSVAPAGAGGAIGNFGGDMTVADSTLSGNSAPAAFLNGVLLAGGVGGGIVNSSSVSYSGGTLTVTAGTLTLTGSTLSGNSATYGGGICNDYSATLVVRGDILGTATVQGRTLPGNSAVGGGGIYNDGMLTVQQSTLSGNTAVSDGGGIFNANGLTVQQSTLTGNTAGSDGGGIYNDSAYIVTVQQSTLSGNTATNAGGGIFNGASGTLMIDDSTVCDNFAALGADLYNLGVASINDSDVCAIAS